MRKFIFIPLLLVTLLPFTVQAQGTAADGTSPDKTLPDSPTASPAPSDPVPPGTGVTAPGGTSAAGTTPKPAPKITPKTAPSASTSGSIVIDTIPNTLPITTSSGDRQNVIIAALSAAGAAILIFFGLNARKKKEKKEDRKCLNIKKLMEDKMNELTDLKGQLENMAKKQVVGQIKNATEGTKAKNLLVFFEERKKEYDKLKELYEKCITALVKEKKVFIFHGTGGYPEENWFPWLKGKLTGKGVQTLVPQFPSSDTEASKISEWLDVLKNYEKDIDQNTILVGHSLGRIFALRVLEKLDHPVHAAYFVGAPIGAGRVLNYDRDKSFSGFDFDWEKIKRNAKHFVVFQSDDDPYVGLENGEALAKNLGVPLSFVPNAGHFNQKAGYTKFEKLWEKIEPVLEK